MESSEEDFLSDLAIQRCSFNEECSSEEKRHALNAMETTNNNESNAEDLFNGDTHEDFGLVPEYTSWPDHDETAAKRQQKDRNHLACESITKLSDEKLEKMSIQAFNKQIRQLPEALMRKFRKRRRILKNRKYALKCRKKDSEKTGNITEENANLELEIFKAKEELRKVARERDEFKLKYTRLNATLIARHSKNSNGAL